MYIDISYLSTVIICGAIKTMYKIIIIKIIYAHCSSSFFSDLPVFFLVPAQSIPHKVYIDNTDEEKKKMYVYILYNLTDSRGILHKRLKTTAERLVQEQGIVN